MRPSWHEDYVTPLRPESLSFIKELIETHGAHTLLEIGTGYGDTTTQLSRWFPELTITTLEKRAPVYKKALTQLAAFENVTCLHVDALKYQPETVFDVIIVDAGKSQQRTLVERYLPYLNNEGSMLVDNIHLSRLKNEPATRSRKALIRKHEAFMDHLKTHPNIFLHLYDLGDGLAVIQKKS
jgi:predicted O-methyltransferase YrrM